MQPTHFQVDADWMKACGWGDENPVMEIISIKHKLVGNKDYVFYTVKHPVFLAADWVVADYRGAPVASVGVLLRQIMVLQGGLLVIKEGSCGSTLFDAQQVARNALATCEMVGMPIKV